MKQVVFTKSAATLLRSPLCAGAAARGVEVRPLASLRRDLKTMDDGSLVYVDIRGAGKPEIARILRLASTHRQLRIGVIDLGGVVRDPAALFHAGIADYIGKGFTGAVFTSARRKAVLTFSARAAEAPAARTLPLPVVPETTTASADGWAAVVSGKDNRFAFLFIEVDDAEELKKRHEPDNLASAMETFKAYVEGITSAHGGRLWMWTRFGGIVLFPLGANSCPAAVCGLRIFLSRIFYDVEESPLPGRLSFRMALSTGHTHYHENDTGRIVSDAINSIFHLGRRFVGAGQFMLTAEACESAPPPIRVLLQSAGVFEGRRILRMQIPWSRSNLRDSGWA